MISKKIPLSSFIYYLKTDKPFSFSRWGDGEWNCMLGEEGGNCDGHLYYPDLGKALTGVLRNNFPYYHGWLNVSNLAGREKIEDHIQKNNIKVEWVDGSVLIDSAIKGELYPFMAELRKKKFCLVGPSYLSKIEKQMNLMTCSHVLVPEVNCWNDRVRIHKDIYSVIDNNRPEVIGFSCGMPSKVFIDHIWNDMRGKITLIDFGSLLDVFAGKKSRTYHGNITAEIIKKNVKG